MVAKRKTTLEPVPFVVSAIQTERSIKLSLYGAGPKPCLDGAHNWLGCAVLIDQPQECPYVPGARCTFARPTSRSRTISFSEESLQQTQAVEDRQALRNWSHSF